MVGCSSRQSPQERYEAIRNETTEGNLESALRHADAAYRDYAGKNIEWAWRFRIQNAQILIRQGSYQQALKLLDEPVPSTLARSDVPVLDKLARALALQYLQQFDRADQELQEAARLTSAASPALLAAVDLQRGMLEVEEKRYDSAAAALHAALSLAQRQNSPLMEVSALGNLGYLAMHQEQYDEAIDWFKRTAEKSRQAGDQSALAINMGNLGWNYAIMGDFENAEASYKQAINSSASLGQANQRIYWSNALADLYLQENRYAKAEKISTQALALASKQDDQRTLTECLNTLSEIELAAGRIGLAEEHNRQAADIEKSGLDRFGILDSQLISGRIAASKKQFSQAEAIFQKILADPSAETPLKWQAESELAQAYAAENQPAKAEHEFQRAINSIQQSRESLHHEEFRLSFLSGAIQFYEAYINFLISRNRPLDALAIADLSRSQSLAESFSEGSRPSTTSIPRFNPRSLAARFHSTLLFYSLGAHSSYLWVITPSKVALFSLPPEQQISSLVASYRQALTASPFDPLSLPDSPGAKLYSILVAPAAGLIPAHSRVIVFPDAALDTLNFDTLIAASPQPHYWIEDATLTVANSLELLARSKSAPIPRNPNLLLVGNVAPADPAFAPLPHAQNEIKFVEHYFPRSRRDVLTGPAATPAAYFASNPGRFQFIHFVTHGTASRLQPLESAVILSPVADSYKLYAREIITRPLHADLVTISACNGAGNRAYAGEGLVGLSWAFLHAGARNVISALWEVSDVSTPQLMNELYQGISRGEDPATALRNAQLQLLHSGGVYQKPYYWAAFQLYSGS